MFKYSDRTQLVQEPAEGLMKLLKTAGRIPGIKPTLFNEEFSATNFIPCTNSLSRAIKNKYFASKDLGVLVLKYTESKTPSNHDSDTRSRPDYTMAFEKNWEGDRISWPLIELVGEKASAGDNEPDLKNLTYLHYLMTARPDLNVVLGFLTTSTGITFYVAVQGTSPTRHSTIAWGAKDLPQMMFAFIYRLYRPGAWDKRNWSRDRAKVSRQRTLGPCTGTFQIRLKTLVGQKIFSRGWRSEYSSNPFQTRTHVLVNVHSDITIDGKRVTVIKDQLCKNTRFTEKEIYDQIHGDGPVPGAAQPVFYAKSQVSDSRTRHITGLHEYGRRILTVKTVDEMLRTVYDVLELLRYLRFKRDVLHRDISVGNILIVDSREVPRPPKSGERKHQDLCFVKHLLDEQYDQHDTQVLLIDFNHGEHVTAKTGADHPRKEQTGTPGFMARAVENRGYLPGPEEVRAIPPIPDAPHSYRKKHPERWADYPPPPSNAPPDFWDPMNPPDSDNYLWRREVDHDSEAVFWVFLYWAVGAQPVGSKSKDELDPMCWTGFTGSWKARNSLLLGAATLQFVHSSLQPLLPLVRRLALILSADRSWLRDGDRRKHPAYIGEALQRVILDFLIRNKDEAFMKLEIDVENRRTPGKLYELHQKELQKRKLESDSQNDNTTKKPRLDGPETNDVPEVQAVQEAQSEPFGGPYPWENPSNNFLKEDEEHEEDEAIDDEDDEEPHDEGENAPEVDDVFE
ncbi:hypothetical protein MD484_g6624, partial [Candolleomyces efflorescens]